MLRTSTVRCTGLPVRLVNSFTVTHTRQLYFSSSHSQQSLQCTTFRSQLHGRHPSQLALTSFDSHSVYHRFSTAAAASAFTPPQPSHAGTIPHTITPFPAPGHAAPPSSDLHSTPTSSPPISSATTTVPHPPSSPPLPPPSSGTPSPDGIPSPSSRPRGRRLRYIAAVLSALTAAAFLIRGPSELYSDVVVLTRFLRTTQTFVSVLIDFKYTWYRHPEGSPSYRDETAALHQRTADRLLALAQANRGLYVKSGQYICSMNHALPPQYINTLRPLQNDAPSMPYETVLRLFAEEFPSQSIEQLYTEFDPVPIAAASIAQVHKARLPDGQLVAVKLQYPNLRKEFGWDLLAHFIVLKCTELAFPRFHLSWMHDEIADNLTKEVSTASTHNTLRSRSHHKLQSFADNFYHFLVRTHVLLSCTVMFLRSSTSLTKLTMPTKAVHTFFVPKIHTPTSHTSTTLAPHTAFSLWNGSTDTK